jgi:hypothetical protein
LFFWCVLKVVNRKHGKHIERTRLAAMINSNHSLALLLVGRKNHLKHKS